MTNCHTKCLICECSNLIKLNDYYEKNGLVKCQSCEFVFMEKIPTLEELNMHYSNYSYTDEAYYSPLTKDVYNSLLDEFEKYRKTGKILDIGCGRGWFLTEAKKRGWEIYGTEYSEAAIELCKENGINMKAGKLEKSTFNNEMFDVITSFEVIEHINNPIEEMKNIHSFLRQGGLFYFTTPNFNSILRYYLKSDYDVIGYPEHLSYYTRKTINKLMLNSGFRLNKFLSTGFSITRLKRSKNNSNEELISNESSDEKLRHQISKKWYLGVSKKIINYFLTLFGIGMTLKGYYVKK
jgi:2-polyprenyl-3-methyl-5-hydroxy-6-metoxy-1,4-benzoquinol methylase